MKIKTLKICLVFLPTCFPFYVGTGGVISNSFSDCQLTASLFVRPKEMPKTGSRVEGYNTIPFWIFLQSSASSVDQLNSSMILFLLFIVRHHGEAPLVTSPFISIATLEIFKRDDKLFWSFRMSYLIFIATMKQNNDFQQGY